MKPTAERYQAATKVNALSPEIDVFVKADSLQELEGSTVHSAMASCDLLFRDLRQGHGIERIALEPGRAFVLLTNQTHFGYVCVNNPGRLWLDTQPVTAQRTRGIGEVDVYKSKRQGNVEGTKGSRTCS